MASEPGNNGTYSGDVFASELIRSLGETQQHEAQQPRQNSGLTTPMFLPQSPFTPPSTGSEAGLSRTGRSLNADKMRRFRRYLQFINVNTVRTGGEDSDDADEFYNEEIYSKRHDTRYVQRPFAFSEKEDVEIEDGAKYAFEMYDVHREQKIKTITQDEAESIPPAMKYDDSLKLREVSKIMLRDTNTAKFKNNLFESYDRFLLLGCMSKILVLDNELSVKYLNTKPFITTTTHREASTWPYFPHTINQLKVCRFQEKDALAVCIDDGRLQIYDLTNMIHDIELPLMIEITMSSSVWGVHTMGDYIAVSDNSKVVTLFHLDGNDLKYGETLELIHNVPDVEILAIKDQSVHVVCTSISGELMRFEFDCSCASTDAAPLVEFPLKYDLPLMKLTNPQKLTISRVRDRTQLQENGWTVNCVDDVYFLEVNDPRYLGGRDKIDTLDMLQRSRILGLMSNHMATSDLGGAAWYETIHIKTKYDEETRTLNRLNSVTDKCSRIKKSYFDLSTEDMSCEGRKRPVLPEFEDKFIVVTTASKVGLYRAHRLICNADTGDMFEFGLIEDMEFSNRMSIVKVIPEISAVVAVSQAGFFTVFRMVKHRGLHSLREEFVLPSSIREEDFSFSEQSILGLAARKLDDYTFWLYFAYSDGMVTKFELRENVESALDLALL